MPMTGRKPKPDGQKRNRMKPVMEWTEVVAVPFRGGRALPAKMPDGKVWPAYTRRWWKSTSSMPHCVLWDDADWAYALDTAIVAARFHLGSMPAATELRNREKVLGTTLDFRRDLRIRYVASSSEASEESPGVTSLRDYREAIG